MTISPTFDSTLLSLDLEIDPEGDSDYLRVTLRYDGETVTSDSVRLPAPQ